MDKKGQFLSQGNTSELQKKVCKAYLSEYIKLTGAEFADIKKWEMPLAAARMDSREQVKKACSLYQKRTRQTSADGELND